MKLSVRVMWEVLFLNPLPFPSLSPRCKKALFVDSVREGTKREKEKGETIFSPRQKKESILVNCVRKLWEYYSFSTSSQLPRSLRRRIEERMIFLVVGEMNKELSNEVL